MDFIEQLLCPQVCMDVEETPIELAKPNSEPDISPEAETSTLPEELKIRMILDNGFNFEDTQIPRSLLPNELEAFNNVYADSDYISRMKFHCTACNKHLGTAPVQQFDSYVHPLLNVIICKSCLNFYGTGDFERDEDGSEIYCKWCAQGGTVMCCSDCPLVFCAKCVRRNLGLNKLNAIKNTDTWKCFVCNPEQITNFHVACHVLHKYIKNQIKLAVSAQNIQMLKSDFSTCCKTKRKRKGSVDEDYEEIAPKRSRAKPSRLPTHPMGATTVKKPTIATGGILKAPGVRFVNSAMSSAQPNLLFQSLQLQSMNESSKQIRFRVGNTPGSNAPTLAQLIPGLFSSVNVNVAAPSTSKPAAASGSGPSTATTVTKQLAFKKPTKTLLRPQTAKTKWLVNSVHAAQHCCSTLVLAATDLNRQANAATNYNHLAILHNKMQQALVTCTSKLIETRRSMYKEFLKYLNKIKVPYSSPSIQNGVVRGGATSIRKSTNNIAAATSISAEIDLCDDDDDVATADRDPLSMDDGEQVDSDGDDLGILPELQPEVIFNCDMDEDTSDTSAIPVDTSDGFEKIIPNFIPEGVVEPVDAAKPAEIEKAPVEEVNVEEVPKATETLVKEKEVGKEVVEEPANKLRESFHRVYRDCVERNAKVPFDASMLTSAEFMRAIQVRTIVDKKVLRDLEPVVPLVDSVPENVEKSEKEDLLKDPLPPSQTPEVEQDPEKLLLTDPPPPSLLPRPEASEIQICLNEIQYGVEPQLGQDGCPVIPMPMEAPALISDNEATTIVQDVLEELANSTITANMEVPLDMDTTFPPLPMQVESTNVGLGCVWASTGVCASDTTIDGDMLPQDV